eukprot:SRR837773.27361.p1 GENE.SRR837773.27361~~SRR837773.27361.p1  ORF type:complete len:116 (+),score=33.72 SRR837773.27361:39-350(+)
MDAELRIELTSRIRLLTAELRGELLREITVRLADAEAKVRVVEVNMGHELQKVSTELWRAVVQARGPRLRRPAAGPRGRVQATGSLRDEVAGGAHSRSLPARR